MNEYIKGDVKFRHSLVCDAVWLTESVHLFMSNLVIYLYLIEALSNTILVIFFSPLYK